MKYFGITTGAGYIGECNDLSMRIAGGADGEVAVFGIPHWDIAFHTDKISPTEPIKTHTFYYEEGDEVKETDLVNAGSPQVVTQAFKDLVEEFDPGCAQFFTTEGTNYKPVKKYFVMHVTKTVKQGSAGGNDHLFRLAENVQKHIVSDKFRKEFKRRGLTGVRFTDVTKLVTGEIKVINPFA